MSIEIRPLEQLLWWNRPRAGALAWWVRWAIATAAVLTVAVVAAGADVLWRTERDYLELTDGVVTVVPLAMTIAIALVFAPPSRTSRFVRLAIALPLLQALALLFVLWFVKTHSLCRLSARAPLGYDVPVVHAGVVGFAATVLAGCLITRRARERVHAMAVIALGNLLLLGLWVPVLTRVWTGTTASLDAAAAALRGPAPLVAAAVVPPFVFACGYAVLVTHAPRRARRLRTAVGVAVVALFVFALAFRLAGYAGNERLYDNLVHIVLAAAFIAIAVTVALGIEVWRATRRATRRLAGEAEPRLALIDDDGDAIVACLQIPSWLRGPRVVARSFRASTERGEVEVPSDLELATELPLLSTVLHTNEAMVVLERGDAVQLAGFVEEHHGDHPFRGTALPVPGPRGVVVGRVGQPRASAWVSVGLAAWRPAVAYLLIIATIAIPGLAGLLTRTMY